MLIYVSFQSFLLLHSFNSVILPFSFVLCMLIVLYIYIYFVVYFICFILSFLYDVNKSYVRLCGCMSYVAIVSRWCSLSFIFFCCCIKRLFSIVLIASTFVFSCVFQLCVVYVLNCVDVIMLFNCLILYSSTTVCKI